MRSLPRATTMNESPLSRLSGAYLAALRIHCMQGSQASSQAAHEIGREAIAIGLETLDLARIHHHALAQLQGPNSNPRRRTDLTARAAAFFTEAITLIEETHSAAQETAADLTQLHAELAERTRDLAKAKDELERRIAARSTAETTLRKSQKTSDQLLKDSQVLEKQLQDLTHQLLSATECEQQEMSRQLNNEIAQTLLGLHMRILALKNEASANHANITQEIAATKRLVTDAKKSTSRLTNEISKRHPR